MARLFANNYVTTLNGAITDVATTITVNSVTGLPAIGGGDTCNLSIDDGTNIEIVKATAVSGFDLTVTRGVEGTSNVAFADTTTIELRDTAGGIFDIEDMSKNIVTTGAVDFGGASSFKIINSDTATVAVNGEMVVDNLVTDFSHGILRYYSGEILGVVAMPIAQFTTPAAGTAVTYNATNDEFELSDSFIKNTGDVGTGVYDFGGADSFEITNSDTATVAVNGQVVIDNLVTDFSHGILKYYSGEVMGVIAVPIAELTTPTDGHVVAYNATNDEFELVASAAGSGPRFAAHRTTTQSITQNTDTKVQFDTEIFDSDADYDPTTNYRFTPSTAGKYLISAGLALQSVVDTKLIRTYIYKNGAAYRQTEFRAAATATQGLYLSEVIDFNGSTDYIEVFVRHDDTTSRLIDPNNSSFSGAFVGT